MQYVQYIIAILVTAALGYWLFNRQVRKAKALAETPQRLFGDIMPFLDDATILTSETAGVWKMQGKYRGHALQFQVIADTLATRKLPSLWLMVTLPEPQSVPATIDLVMRPSGPTTFSKFDFLPYTLPTPEGYPEHAVIRSDVEAMEIPADAIRRQLGDFQDMHGKELLLSSKGLRIVVQAAEADRARYGAFREANFGEKVIDVALARRCMDMLLALHDELNANG